MLTKEVSHQLVPLIIGLKQKNYENFKYAY